MSFDKNLDDITAVIIIFVKVYKYAELRTKPDATNTSYIYIYQVRRQLMTRRRLTVSRLLITVLASQLINSGRHTVSRLLITVMHTYQAAN